jgi:hypothetical protein
VAGVYQWVASYSGDANNKPVASAKGDEPATVYLQITGFKFDDANGNGTYDSGEAKLKGWTIQLYKESNNTAGLQTGTGGDTLVGSKVTDASGNYSFTGLLPGTYYLREVSQSGWVQTVGNLNVTTSVNVVDNFGNAHVTTSPLGPLTLGYYGSASNGRKDLTGSTTGTTLLAGVYNYLFGPSGVLVKPGSTTLSVLVDGSGSYKPLSFFQSYANLANFLNNASATNMAYMLSAQLLTTELNIYFGRVNPSQYIYIPNVSGMSSADLNALHSPPGGLSAVSGNFVQIQAALTDAIQALVAYPNTTATATQRYYEEALKNMFNSINNNGNIFVS